MKKIYKTIATLGIILVALGFLCLGGIFSVFWYFGYQLPDYQQLADYEPRTVTRIHAGDGRLLAEFGRQNRVFVPIRAIPKGVKNAFLAAEDKNFFRHYGVDFFSIGRAILTNIGRLGTNQRLVGASTITQQVAKNFLLTNETSLNRKIKEAILAFRIERALSKNRILELYLNEIYLGMGSYGVAAAALNYFNKSLNKLTVSEAAFLAGLPKAPNNYHPIKEYKAAKMRRNYVISRMFANDYITGSEATNAKGEPLVVRRRSEALNTEAGYFVEDVRRELMQRFGEAKLYGGGLSVRTTLQPDLQIIADSSLRDGLIKYDRRHGWRGPLSRIPVNQNWLLSLRNYPEPVYLKTILPKWRKAVVLSIENKQAELGFVDGSSGFLPPNELKWAGIKESKNQPDHRKKPTKQGLRVGDVVLVQALNSEMRKSRKSRSSFRLRQIPEVNGAIVAIAPHTGRVLAMTGGFSYFKSEFNRATQARRQPGSAFKPFVYLAALDSGYTPSSIVIDAPFVFDQGPGLIQWKPSNYTNKFYGPSPIRIGIEKSRNLMTVRLAQMIGMEIIADYAERFGIVDHMPRMLSMALGAGETTLFKLTTAYGMLVNGGKKINATLIDRVQNRQGKTIFRHEKRNCKLCKNIEWDRQAVPKLPENRQFLVDTRSAYQIVAMLEGVVKRGTGRRLRKVGKPLAGKTGTTNNSLDTWFVGFSPNLVVGVFVGFDEPRPLGRGETGASLAAPIFQSFMSKALAKKPPIPFRIPKGIRLVRINALTGKRALPGDKPVILEAYKNETSIENNGDGQPTISTLPVGGVKGLY